MDQACQLGKPKKKKKKKKGEKMFSLMPMSERATAEGWLPVVTVQWWAGGQKVCACEGDGGRERKERG